MSGFLGPFLDGIASGSIDNLRDTLITGLVDKGDDDGRTALHWACAHNVLPNADVVKHLIENGWTIENEDNNKYRPIHIAARSGHISIVKELINRGCLLEERNNEGHTPLDLAIKYKNTECAEILQEEILKQPDINRKMNYAIKDLGKKKEKLLGEGGFGQVIRCVDDKLGYDFAVKKVRIIADNLNAGIVSAIEDEIISYTIIKEHDRIVKYYGTHRDESAIYIFMEPISNGSIADYLKELGEHGALEHSTIARYTKQSLDALAFLHGKQIIHRDIKCANILRDSNDNIKLCDFGVSRYFLTMSTSSASNQANTVCGTFYWMAPEVIKGEKYRYSADVWSLGATVVEMLSGKHPYPEDEPYQAFFKIGHTGKLLYKSKYPISETFQSFIDQMLVADPENRANIDSLMQSEFIMNSS